MIDSDLDLHPLLGRIASGESRPGIGLFGASRAEVAYRGYRRCPLHREEMHLAEGRVAGQAILVCDTVLEFPPPEKDRRYGTPVPDWPEVYGFLVCSALSGGYVVWRRWMPEPLSPDKGMALQADFFLGLTVIGNRLAVAGLDNNADGSKATEGD